MSVKSNDSLDSLLLQWAAHRRAGSERLERLRSRIVAALDAEGRDRHESSLENRGPRIADRAILIPQSSTRALSSLVVCVGISVAALALVAVLLSLFPSPRVPFEARHFDDAPFPVADMSDSEQRQNAVLFAELDRLFDERLAWVAETDRDVNIGLESSPGGPHEDEEGRPVILRLVLVQRASGAARWTPVRAVDVLSREQRVLRLSREEMGDFELSAWIFVLEDGMFAVETELDLTAPIRIHMPTNGVYQPGTFATVHSMRQDNSEYRLLQAVRSVTTG